MCIPKSFLGELYIDVSIVTHIIAANDKNGLTEEEIEAHAQVLIIAGSETSTSCKAMPLGILT